MEKQSKDEVVQGNRLIVKFMNAECYGVLETGGNPLKAIYPYSKISKYEALGYKTQLDYHCNWGALMPVVEKIENLDGCYFFRIQFCTVSVNNTDILFNCPPANFGLNAKNKIHAVWQAVIQFITWYNSLTPTPSNKS